MYLSDTTPYNSYNGIYPQRLLTTIIQEIQFLTTYNYDFIINECYYDLQLETALCYQHYFCNTELRTAIITKIKGLSIQAQQNTFVLFTLFKLTLDERKTLTKILTCKPLTTVPQTSAHLGHEGTRKPANCNLRQKAFCITGGESEALGFHQETMEESRKQQDWFCIKLYIISYQTSFILAVWF